MPSEPGPTPLRRLGNAEKYSATRSDLGIYLNVGLTACYKRTEGVPVKPALFQALSNLISKHPILSAVPVATDRTCSYFVRLPSIVLSEVVTFVRVHDQPGSAQWRVQLDELLERQHNRPFSIGENRPLWRMCVVGCDEASRHFSLVLMFHHSLMDTKSALSFHEELECLMNEGKSSAEDIDVIQTPSAPLLPPLEELHPLPVSPQFLRNQSKPQEPSCDSWTGAPQAAPVRTHFSSLWMSQAATRGLVKKAQEERASVTAALQAMIADSVFSAIPSTYQTLQADCAISLRGFLPEPITETSLGCYVGSLSVVYNRMGSFNWDEARRTKCIIEETMAKRGSDMPVGYLRYIPNLKTWMCSKLGQKRMSAFELSNVGIISSAPRNCPNFAMGGMLFSQSSSACSAAIKISAVTGRDGRLVVGFTWQEGIVDPEMIESVKIALHEHVEQLALEVY